MEQNLDLLIQLGCYSAFWVILHFGIKVCDRFFDVFFGLHTLIVFLIVKRKGQLHVEGNKFYKRYQKVCLLNGKPNPSWEEYESHFVNEVFYYESKKQ